MLVLQKVAVVHVVTREFPERIDQPYRISGPEQNRVLPASFAGRCNPPVDTKTDSGCQALQVQDPLSFDQVGIIADLT